MGAAATATDPSAALSTLIHEMIEIYLLIRGLAHTTAATPVPAAVLDRAVEVILAGFATR